MLNAMYNTIFTLKISSSFWFAVLFLFKQQFVVLAPAVG